MSQSNSDEIDLGVVFSKIKQGLTAVIINLFHGLQFIIRNWWIILIMAGLGWAAGYFYSKNKKYPKTVEIVVQNSFKSSSYVYSAIEQLNNKVREKDITYLKDAGFSNPYALGKIEIEPIVNLLELMEKTIYSYRTLEPLLEKADFEDDILTSEVFHPEYRYHKITMNTAAFAEDKTILELINFLNTNEKFNELKRVIIEDTELHIKEFETTVAHINNILEAYPKNIEDGNSSDQIFISTGSTVTDLGDLVSSKLNILNQKEKLKTELVKYDKIVTVMNKPSLQQKAPLIVLNGKNVAVLFVLLYLLFFYLKGKYSQVKKLAEK